MTDQLAEQAPKPDPAPEASRDKDVQARSAYAASLRRPRILYTAVITAVLAALVVTVVLAYQHGEAAHTSLHAVSTPPPAITVRTPAKSVTQAWSSTDAAAIGTPYWSGTVVTHDAHTVRGRNGTTGAETWSYTRDDRTLCTVVQDAGVTLALYRVGGNCDEMTALNSSTGARKWTRTYDKDAQPLNGTPHVLINNSTLVLWTPTVVYATAADDPHGLDRWQFQRPGCTINGVAYGTSGALISTTCTGVQCKTGEKFCGDGPQLFLRNAYNGQDTSKSENPDMITWSLMGSTLMPVAADTQIVASSAKHLAVLGSKSGKTVATTDLTDPGQTADAVEISSTELVWTGGRTYSISGNTEDWDTAMRALPTISGKDGADPAIDSGVFAVPGKSGIDLLDLVEGTVKRSVTVNGGTIPDGARAWPYGTGFLVAGEQTSVWR
ncbi:MAG TPA: hypothetical protein VGL26_11305 [Jatrophihabitans sp.]